MNNRIPKNVERREMQPEVEKALREAFDGMDAPFTHDHARRLQRTLLRIAARISFETLDQGHPSFLSQAESMFDEEHSSDNAASLPPTMLAPTKTVSTDPPLIIGDPEFHMDGLKTNWGQLKSFIDDEVLPLIPAGKPVTDFHYDTARVGLDKVNGHLHALKKKG